jgi:hypothetical protein
LICNKLQPICNWGMVENKKIQQQRWGSWIEKDDEKQCKWKWSINAMIKVKTSQLTQQDSLLRHFGLSRGSEMVCPKQSYLWCHDKNPSTFQRSKSRNNFLKNQIHGYVHDANN